MPGGDDAPAGHPWSEGLGVALAASHDTFCVAHWAHGYAHQVHPRAHRYEHAYTYTRRRTERARRVQRRMKKNRRDRKSVV